MVLLPKAAPILTATNYWVEYWKDGGWFTFKNKPRTFGWAMSDCEENDSLFRRIRQSDGCVVAGFYRDERIF